MKKLLSLFVLMVCTLSAFAQAQTPRWIKFVAEKQDANCAGYWTVTVGGKEVHSGEAAWKEEFAYDVPVTVSAACQEAKHHVVIAVNGKEMTPGPNTDFTKSYSTDFHLNDAVGTTDHDTVVVKVSFKNVKTINVKRSEKFDFNNGTVTAYVTPKAAAPSSQFSQSIASGANYTHFLIDEGDSLYFVSNITANNKDRMGVTFNGDTTYYAKKKTDGGLESPKFAITNNDSIILANRDTCVFKFTLDPEKFGKDTCKVDDYKVYVYNPTEKESKTYTPCYNEKDSLLGYFLNTDTLKFKSGYLGKYIYGTVNEGDTAYVVPSCSKNHDVVVVVNDKLAKKTKFDSKDAFKFTTAPQQEEDKDYADTCNVVAKFFHTYKVSYSLKEKSDTVTADKKIANNYVKYQFDKKLDGTDWKELKLDSTSYVLPQNYNTTDEVSKYAWEDHDNYAPAQLPDSIEIYTKSEKGYHVFVTINGDTIPAKAISKYAGTSTNATNTRSLKNFNVYLDSLGVKNGEAIKVQYEFKKHQELTIETYGKTQNCDTLMAEVVCKTTGKTTTRTYYNKNTSWQDVTNLGFNDKKLELTTTDNDVDSASVVTLKFGCVNKDEHNHPIAVFSNDTLVKSKDGVYTFNMNNMKEATTIKVVYDAYAMLLTDSLKDSKDQWNWKGDNTPVEVKTMAHNVANARQTAPATPNDGWYILKPKAEYTINGFCSDTVHHMRVTINGKPQATTVDKKAFYCSFTATDTTRLDVRFLSHYFVNVTSVAPCAGTFKMTANGYDKKEMKVGVNTVEEGDTLTFAHVKDAQHMKVFLGKNDTILHLKDTLSFVLNGADKKMTGDTVYARVDFKKNFTVKLTSPAKSTVDGDTCVAYVFDPYTKTYYDNKKDSAYVRNVKATDETVAANWKEVKNDSVVEEGSKVAYFAWCNKPIKKGTQIVDAKHHIYTTVNYDEQKMDTIASLGALANAFILGDTIDAVKEDYDINFDYKRHFLFKYEQTNRPKKAGDSDIVAVRKLNSGWNESETLLYEDSVYDLDENVDSFFMRPTEVDTMFIVPAIGVTGQTAYIMPDSLATNIEDEANHPYAFTVRPVDTNKAKLALKNNATTFDVAWVGDKEKRDTVEVDFGYFKKCKFDFDAPVDSVNPNCDTYMVFYKNYNTTGKGMDGDGWIMLPNQHKQGWEFPAVLTHYLFMTRCMNDSVKYQHHAIASVNGKRYNMISVDVEDYREWQSEEETLMGNTDIKFVFAKQAILKLTIDKDKYVADDDEIHVTVDGKTYELYQFWNVYGKEASIYQGATVKIWAQSLNSDRKPALVVGTVNEDKTVNFVEVPFDEKTNEATFTLDAPVVAAVISFYSASGINDVNADSTMKDGKFLNNKNQVIIVKNGKQYTTAGQAVK